MSQITVGYSPNDFFYVSAEQDGTMPNGSQCNSLSPSDTHWDISCNSANFGKYYSDCVSKELCKNRDNVTNLYKLNNVHSGSDQNYLDTKTRYNEELINSFNLGMGIVLLSGLIYRFSRK